MKPRFDVRSLAIVLSGIAVAALPAKADAPLGQYTVDVGSVADNKSGLTWDRTPPTATYTWAQAKSYCATTLGSPWRLPTRKELLTIVDFTKANPAIDITAFPGTTGVPFWSATPFAVNTTKAWYVNFIDGSTTPGTETTMYRFRCVR